ncbi:hypothetical protein LTR17_027162 [Elasticomyces elasticus]|nr:hypothetical protein LTR17_027162 [Elasticomyces elasticus]
MSSSMHESTNNLDHSQTPGLLLHLLPPPAGEPRMEPLPMTHLGLRNQRRIVENITRNPKISARDVKSKSFLNLPPEIRNDIYVLALGSEQVYQLVLERCERTRKRCARMIPDMPGIINARQQTADEALAMSYSAHTFEFMQPLCESQFSTTRDQVAKKCMNHIIIEGDLCTARDVAIKSFGLTVQVKDATLKIAHDYYLKRKCMCRMSEDLESGATRRAQESDGKMGLAYAAIDCFIKEQLEGVESVVEWRSTGLVRRLQQTAHTRLRGRLMDEEAPSSCRWQSTCNKTVFLHFSGPQVCTVSQRIVHEPVE